MSDARFATSRTSATTDSSVPTGATLAVPRPAQAIVTGVPGRRASWAGSGLYHRTYDPNGVWLQAGGAGAADPSRAAPAPMRG